MLRASRLNPRLSVYTQLEGGFNFDATPLAPSGCKVIIHERPKQRNSWDRHGKLGWYLGPELEHYRCYRLYYNETMGERFSDVVEFIPSHVTIPHPSSIETTTKIALDHTTALQNPLTMYNYAPMYNFIRFLNPIFLTIYKFPLRTSLRIHYNE